VPFLTSKFYGVTDKETPREVDRRTHNAYGSLVLSALMDSIRELVTMINLILLSCNLQFFKRTFIHCVSDPANGLLRLLKYNLLA
jgi:hypothetical protein